MSVITKAGHRLIFCKKRGYDHSSYDRYIGQTVTLAEPKDLSPPHGIAYVKFNDGQTLAVYNEWVRPYSGFAMWIKERGL